MEDDGTTTNLEIPILEPDPSVHVSDTTHKNHPAFRSDYLVHDQIGEKPWGEMVRLELALDPVFAEGPGGRHDSRIVDHDIDFFHIGPRIDLSSCRANGTESAEIERDEFDGDVGGDGGDLVSCGRERCG